MQKIPPDTILDSQVLKLTGKAELPKPLTIGHNYEIKLNGSITGINKSDNNDGSFTYYHKFEPILVEVITEKGERIKAKDTRRKSQMLRSCIWKTWQDSKKNIEFEKYYDDRMSQIIRSVIEGEEFKNNY